MRRVEPQRRFSQKTVQLTAPSRLRLARDWDFAPFSPISSQLVPNAASSVFITEDDVPPCNQLEAHQQLVVTSLVHPGGLQLPEVVALPLSELQKETAYSLLRTLR